MACTVILFADFLGTGSISANPNNGGNNANNGNGNNGPNSGASTNDDDDDGLDTFEIGKSILK